MLLPRPPAAGTPATPLGLFRLLGALAVVLGALALTSPPAWAQVLSHNLGETPPPCSVAQMIQNDGSFPPGPYGPPGCLLPNNAGIAIAGAQAIYDGKGFFRLEVEASGGSIMLHGQSYPVNYVVLWNYYDARAGRDRARR